jgi:hypothetical protein
MYPDAQESVRSLGADIGLESTKEGSSVLSDYELVLDFASRREPREVVDRQTTSHQR